jgi:hypothetical protein
MTNIAYHLEGSSHWRLCAEEMRAVADGMKDLANQATARNLADDYDRMAEHTERHERQNAAK